MIARVHRVLAALPRGNRLPDATWQRRHRLLLGLLLAHLPLLVLVAAIAGHRLSFLSVELAAVAGAAVVGGRARGRTIGALAVTVGLSLCSTTLVHYSGGRVEAHFHYFVVLAFVALYEDWRPFAVAVGFVVLGHGVVGVLAPEAFYAHEAAGRRPWLWALTHGGAMLLAAAAQLVFWSTTYRQQREAERHYQELYERERALVEKLRRAEQLERELVSIVSHEFRTPLAAVSGFAKTLTARLDHFDRETALTCARSIERQSRRLTRLVSNLLAADGEVSVQLDAATDLRRTAGEVVEEVLDFAPATTRQVRLDIPEGLAVAMSADATRRVVLNLVDNALKFAEPHTEVSVRARAVEDDVLLEVTNVGEGVAEADRERIFEPFTQLDSSDSRRFGGLGLGLSVVRRLVEAHGGRVDVRQAGHRTVFTAVLKAARIAFPGCTDEQDDVRVVRIIRLDDHPAVVRSIRG